jgi:hypothetical protein
MPLNKVDATLLNIDRIVEIGNKDILQLVDRSNKEVLADIKRWNFRRLNPIQIGAPTYEFKFVVDVITREFVPTCVIALNGLIHDVVVRDLPDSLTSTICNFKTKPTNERVV